MPRLLRSSRGSGIKFDSQYHLDAFLAVRDIILFINLGIYSKNVR